MPTGRQIGLGAGPGPARVRVRYALLPMDPNIHGHGSFPRPFAKSSSQGAVNGSGSLPTGKHTPPRASDPRRGLTSNQTDRFLPILAGVVLCSWRIALSKLTAWSKFEPQISSHGSAGP